MAGEERDDLADLTGVGGVLEQNVVSAALHDGDGGDQGELGLVAQLGDAQSAAVAHGGANLGQGGSHTVGQLAGIGNVGVNAFLEAQLGAAAQVVALQLRARALPSPQYSFM